MTKDEPRRHKPLPHIGWREWVRLPELDDGLVKAKIDTGARTSALHALDQKPFVRNDHRWIRFRLHPSSEQWCEAPLLERRRVRNSGGHEEERHVIRTRVALDDDAWTIEITLTNRSTMGFPMLLGRLAIRNRFLVDTGRSFLQSRQLQRQHRHSTGTHGWHAARRNTSHQDDH